MEDNRETIRGFIIDADLKAKSRDAGDDDDDDGDEENEFLEMADIKAAINGAFPSKSINVPEKKVKFFNEMTKISVTVKGVFLFPEYWWYIEAEVHRKSKRLCHMPRYRVKNLWNRRCVTAYLQACGIDDRACVAANKMMDRVHCNREEYTVQQVLDLPNLRGKFEGIPLFDEEKAVLASLEQNLCVAGHTALIKRALSYPNLFWSLPSILPKKAYSILSHNIDSPGRKSKKGASSFESHSPKFEELNVAITESPWELGFSSILYKKYNLCGCEAALQDLEESGILVKLDDVMKDNLTVYNKLKAHCLRNGHTFRYCPTNTSSLLSIECESRNKTQQFLCSDYTGAARCEPRTSNHRKIPALYLRRYWNAEKSIARQLRKIVRQKTAHAAFNELPELEGADWTGLDSSQQRAVNCIRTQPLTILSGMGGCGKTTVVSRLVSGYCESLSSMDDQQETDNNQENVVSELVTGYGESLSNMDDLRENGNDHEHTTDIPAEPPEEEGVKASEGGPSRGHILLTAPTGKAASLLGKKCGMAAYTIHRVIYSHMAWRKGSDFPWAFAKTKMLVVDECSMVAVTTFERLLDILLRDSSLSKVVLVGDIRQLPSVEPGNFFEDVFEVAEANGLAVDLETNHRVDSGGRIIVENARRISQKEMPKFDEVTLELPRMPTPRFYFLEVSGESAKAQDDTLDRLRQLLESNRECIKDPSSSQIITFTRRLVAEANKDCCQHYNQHYPHFNNKRDFRPNDKICCRKNCEVGNPKYVPSSEDMEKSGGENSTTEGSIATEGGEKSTYRISNGDTFIIKEIKTVVGHDGRQTEQALLDDMESEQICVDFKSFRRIGKVEHAWCRTIHTFQGSEVKSVVYLLSGSKPESWKHVYTAVTRGQQEVVVIGRRDHLRRALATEYKRDTGLRGFLQRALAAPDDQDDLDASSPGADAEIDDTMNGDLNPLGDGISDESHGEDEEAASFQAAPAALDMSTGGHPSEPAVWTSDLVTSDISENGEDLEHDSWDELCSEWTNSVDNVSCPNENFHKYTRIPEEGCSSSAGKNPGKPAVPTADMVTFDIDVNLKKLVGGFQKFTGTHEEGESSSACGRSSKPAVRTSDLVTPDIAGNMEGLDSDSGEDNCPQWARSIDEVSPPDRGFQKYTGAHEEGDSCSAGGHPSKSAVRTSDLVTSDVAGNMEGLNSESGEDNCPQWACSIDGVSPPDREFQKYTGIHEDDDSSSTKVDNNLCAGGDRSQAVKKKAGYQSPSSGTALSIRNNVSPDDIPGTSSMCIDWCSNLRAVTPRAVPQFQPREPKNSPSTTWGSYRDVESISPDRLADTPKTPKKQMSQFKSKTPSNEAGACNRNATPENHYRKMTPSGRASSQFKKKCMNSSSSDMTDDGSRQETGEPHQLSMNLSPESEEFKELSLSTPGGKRSSRKRLAFQVSHSSRKSPKK